MMFLSLWDKIGATFGLLMGKLPLDRIGVPLAYLVQARSSHRSETVRRHLIGAIAEPSQSRIERVLRDRLKIPREAG